MPAKPLAPVANYQFNDVELLAEQSAYRGFFEVRTLNLKHRLYAGAMSHAIQRELFIRHDAVGVLLYDPQLDAICLVEQFRVGAFGHEYLADKNADECQSPWVLELVAGLIDKDEPPALVAERESVEEAGVVIEALEPIAQYYSSPGGSTEYFYLYCGCANLAGAGGIFGVADESEDIRAQVIACSEIPALMAAGKVNNAHTLIALQWLQLNQPRLREQWLASASRG
jgi:ADP-ribose pyrophosphatase